MPVDSILNRKLADARPMPGAPVRIAAVLACFNRRQQTIACLTSLQAAANHAVIDLEIIVVDDGSTDGTAAAVLALCPDATVIESPGNLFWNRSMHMGMAESMRRCISHILWLNDDTLLERDALRRMLGEARAIELQSGKPIIMVGATCDPDGRLTYGGSVARNRLLCLHYLRVWNASQPVACDVMNGNCVLLPLLLVRCVGNLDPVYEHAMGDTDYALRARRAGFEAYITSGFVGQCLTNSMTGTYSDTSQPLAIRWRQILHRKGLPWRSWLHFTRQYGGLLWPIYFAWPYCRLILSSVWKRRSVKSL